MSSKSSRSIWFLLFSCFLVLAGFIKIAHADYPLASYPYTVSDASGTLEVYADNQYICSGTPFPPGNFIDLDSFSGSGAHEDGLVCDGTLQSNFNFGNNGWGMSAAGSSLAANFGAATNTLYGFYNNNPNLGWYLDDDDVLVISQTSPASTSVSLDPIFSGTIPDFHAWVIDWSGAVPYGVIHVAYGFSTSTFEYNDTADFSPYVSSNPFAFNKTQPLFYVPLSNPATWYAQAYDVGATETVYSVIVSFQVSPEASPPASSTSTILAGFLGIPTSTITEVGSCSTLTSTDPFGIEMFICNALNFLFVPNTAEQQNLGVLFSGLQTTYGNKPPFGYFTAISTAISAFNIEGTSTSIFDLDATTTAGVAGVFNPLDLGLASIVWLLTAFWVFHRARTIQL